MSERLIHDVCDPRGAIIWLHGLGADAHDFVPMLPYLGLTSTRVIFPNAPVRAVTINGGAPMRAWYDFTSLDFSKGENDRHIIESIGLIETLVDEQVDAGLQPARIVLAGFSQGGVVALAAALRSRRTLAGVIALSTYLPRSFRDIAAVRCLPILQCHGRQDAVIPLTVGEDTARFLVNAGHDHRWRAFEMGHEVCMDEIDEIRTWLKRHDFA
ncbi:MAG: alpha/beta hydrolase [Thiotrichales bacterium]